MSESDFEASSHNVPTGLSGVSDTSPPGTVITFQVSERRFATTVETLAQGSGFFSSMLSGRWENVQADGLYFIDADPKLFEHILRCLRRGELPFFYNTRNGHDHALYLALLEEAKFFQIEGLENWIRSEKYLHAVKNVHSGVELDAADGIDEAIRMKRLNITLPSGLKRSIFTQEAFPGTWASH